jgi:hypothetical protein
MESATEVQEWFWNGLTRLKQAFNRVKAIARSTAATRAEALKMLSNPVIWQTIHPSAICAHPIFARPMRSHAEYQRFVEDLRKVRQGNARAGASLATFRRKNHFSQKPVDERAVARNRKAPSDSSVGGHLDAAFG